MKNMRGGQAQILSSAQLNQLIAELPAGSHRTLATVMRFTGARVSEARQLTWGCITRNAILYPKAITKGKLASRTINMHPDLLVVLERWRSDWNTINGRKPQSDDWIFPGRSVSAPITRQAFGLALKGASAHCRFEKVSSHTFRRSALTAAKSAGVPLADIRAISGHKNLASLSIYLHTSEEEKKAVVMSFA